MNGMESSKETILSICIPTWNRSHFLKKSLSSLKKQISEQNKKLLEIYVSDNCSDDDTKDVVESFISNGLPIKYFRQKENVGASRNFIHCMNECSGRYVLLLGDDDILKDGALEKIINVLVDNDYGLVYIYDNKATGKSKEFENSEEFLMYLSYWITFMSGNIFLREVVSKIDSTKYTGTHLLQMPYYILSALSRKKNLAFGEKIIEGSLDKKNNGGFNFYEVFVRNYLNIYKEFVTNKIMTIGTYKWLKRDIYFHYIIPYNFKFFFLKQNVKKEDGLQNQRSGYKIDGANIILKDYYGKEYYYYFSFIGYIRSAIGYFYHLFF